LYIELLIIEFIGVLICEYIIYVLFEIELVIFDDKCYSDYIIGNLIYFINCIFYWLQN